ncbi:hypothetical protein N7470_003414 [Penicillium chermesinum]|nr:hypothetical protein N7470_003414 [Penicillium chermesinum]
MVGMGDINLNLWPTPAAAMTEGGAAVEAIAAASEAVADTQGGVAEVAAQADGWYLTEFMNTMRKVGGFFGYLTSVWSMACLVEALILNRLTIYASTRRHLRLGWQGRLALRIVPIVLFIYQIMSLLRGIRCQSSPDYATMRYGSPGKVMIFDYASSGGPLYRYFVETLSCALQGRNVKTETGMTIFEHSLAFAEAESMIGKSIGLGMFGLPKKNPLSQAETTNGSTSPLELLTRAQVLERMNVTPELLLIVLISCCNSLTSHALEIFGSQSRYRLANTAVWGLCFMFAMCWGLDNGPPVSLETGVLKFPTVCIVSFIPHLLVLLGIITCLVIYGLALTITAFSLQFEENVQPTLRERFTLAHENMQGSNQIQNIRINRHEDFYTSLLRVGYVALTAASEAVFLNEGKAVIARPLTWLEQDRVAEIEATRQSGRAHADPHRRSGDHSPFDLANFLNSESQDSSSEWETGYSRERKMEKPKKGSQTTQSPDEIGGVGAARASLRLWHGVTFFRAIFWLILKWLACGLSRVLDSMGIRFKPQWLKRLVGSRKNRVTSRTVHNDLDFLVLNADGRLEVPQNRDFDVELEIRKMESLMNEHSNWAGPDENRLDEQLYKWWKQGGAWGNQDHSSDYIPPAELDNEDITSVVSMSTNASGSDWEDYGWESRSSDGRRTPTQSDPNPGLSRESTPSQEPLMDLTTLARLLDPHDRESREEARILAAHLRPQEGAGRIITRSQYRQQLERERSRVLFSSRVHNPIPLEPGRPRRKPTAQEESEILERLILACRAAVPISSDSASWESGAIGLGPNGPPCVVCQTSPRSIITWPCRCLCICEDCRVSLAMNNFGSCVTCRQNVGGYMRLWVP